MPRGSSSWRVGVGHVLALGLMVLVLVGCPDTRLIFTQTVKGAPETFLLTARKCTWANTLEGGACLALTYQWDTHAGQFILQGIRSSYVRLVIYLPKPLSGADDGHGYQLRPGMVQAYDDGTDRGVCYTGGPGRITIRCDKDNKATGSFEVTCRGFLPGREKTSRFSDDYTLRAEFVAHPDATATLRTAADVGWFFVTPERRPVPATRPGTGRGK